MSQVLDGYWLPGKIRETLITAETLWITQCYKAGRPADAEEPGAVCVRWPLFSTSQWSQLLAMLKEQRIPPPADFIDRLQGALEALSKRFGDPKDSLNQEALSTIPAYTGYAPEMIQFVLGALDLMPLDTLAEIVDLSLPGKIRRQFVPFRDQGMLKGRVRFYGHGAGGFLTRLFSGYRQENFPYQSRHPDLILGYAAGNVIGTAHLISMLAQVSSLIAPGVLTEEPRIPAVLIKNSRQEPIFGPLIFSALEQIDPQLTRTVSLMIWDYDDNITQESLISRSDLVIAAAADFTIDQIDEVIQRVQTPSHPIRFHKHGHKVSFSTIGSAYLKKNMPVPDISGLEMVHLVTTLAAVDSIFWDQYGCLSSRVHFIQSGGADAYTPLEYGHFLAEKIRLLSRFLPRGAIPLHGLHNRFEKYAAMVPSGQVELCSSYEDDFLVIVDSRKWIAHTFQGVVNDCIERTIVIRPVENLMEVPRQYLGSLPEKNLQTMSVAIDAPGQETWSDEFYRFVDAVGKLGVTGVRTVGRGAFPQMAYSWDGYLPLDLSLERPEGYFTTVEFEDTFGQILDTYQLYASRVGMGAM